MQCAHHHLAARRLIDGFKRHWLSPGNVAGAFLNGRLRCSPRGAPVSRAHEFQNWNPSKEQQSRALKDIRPINNFHNEIVEFASNICSLLCVLCHHTPTCFMVVSGASIWRKQWTRLKDSVALPEWCNSPRLSSHCCSQTGRSFWFCSCWGWI